MGAIDKLLRRFGYAQLSRYGLVLTPDERVVSLRPEVLHDRFGGRVVGWHGDDLAALDLPRWDSQGPAGPARATSDPTISPPRRVELVSMDMVESETPALARGSQRVMVPEMQPEPSAAIATPSAPPMTAIAASEPAPVTAPIVEEEDWEWQIAAARARASSPDGAPADAAAVAGPVTARQLASFGAPEFSGSRETAPENAPLARLPRVARGTVAPPPSAAPEPRAARDTVPPPASVAAEPHAPRVEPAARPAPATVIAVPTLPVANTTAMWRPDAVVRSAARELQLNSRGRATPPAPRTAQLRDTREVKPR